MALCFLHRRLFKAISVTGVRCWASCRMCRGSYLRQMIDASSGLLETVLSLVRKGVRGILISGGFETDLTLPVRSYLKHLPRIRPLLKVISVHAGMQRNPLVLGELRRFIDVVDVEFVASQRDAAEMRGVDARIYVETLEAMWEAGLDVVPHVFLWTPWRSIEDLLAELRTLRSIGFERATLLVLLGFGDPPRRVVEWLEKARDAFDGELYLGCMRPYSAKRWLDRVAMERSLVDRIANPYPGCMGLCEGVFDACCSIPRNKLMDFYAEPIHR